MVQRVLKDTNTQILLLGFQYILQLQLFLSYEYKVININDPSNSLFLDIFPTDHLVELGFLVKHILIGGFRFDALDLVGQLLLIRLINSIVVDWCCFGALFALFVCHVIINAINTF